MVTRMTESLFTIRYCHRYSEPVVATLATPLALWLEQLQLYKTCTLPTVACRQRRLWVASCRSRRLHCAGQIQCKQLVRSNANDRSAAMQTGGQVEGYFPCTSTRRPTETGTAAPGCCVSPSPDNLIGSERFRAVHIRCASLALSQRHEQKPTQNPDLRYHHR